MPGSPSHYIGRFAPTPSGPLHFGSIVAALGSYLDARSNRGTWLVRIDDLDTPRVKAGADVQILNTLDELGMHWDGNILYQSQRQQAYEKAEHQLQHRKLLFPCYCSRKQLKGKPYPGTCRNQQIKTDQQYATRILTTSDVYTLDDKIQGEFSQNLSEDIGDFIIRRADGLFAYHLAVVVDDAHQDITHNVRGADLMDSSPRQIFLQQQLGLPTPLYFHLPVAVSQSGEKICKQHKAEDVLLNNLPVNVLFDCLQFLGQNPEQTLLENSVDEVMQWGIENWRLNDVPRRPEIVAAENYQSPAR